ncbi:radical SAM protein [Candidatus Woesearchaeota archaeon]|nr:radical SAM protein [Candidatus Woesearchaeota archaeon]
MALLEFKDLSFAEKGNKIEVTLLKNFYFFIEKSDLLKISPYKISKNSIEFKDISEKKVSKKFNFLLSNSIRSLKSRINSKKSTYIHQNSGIPLIGTNYFGLIDRNTSIIEVKPITGCNLNCIYCSVDEGLSSKRGVDFVVEKDYIIKELKKLADFKAIDGLEAHINAQGETLLYAGIVELVADIAKIKQIKAISIDTNGTLLTKQHVDELAKAGLTRFNLSLNALDQKIAEKMAGCDYNLNKVLEIARYIPKKTDLIIAPLYLPGYNDKELSKLAEFALEIGAGKNCPPIGIQNFLSYRFGRNPAKALPMDDFYKKLKNMEKEYGIKLIFKDWFGLKKTKPLPKPFEKGDITKARIVCNGRLRNEKLAVSGNRVISVPDCAEEGQVKLKITRTKHNIFVGILL